MGVLLQGFFFAPGRIAGVPSPADGMASTPWWWDHLASQASDFARAGFSAIWLPPPHKGASGTFSSGYDLFDDYDLGSKDQKGTLPTRYGSREQLQRCAAVLRANDIDVYIDLVENQRDGDDGHFNFSYVGAGGVAGKGRFAKGPNDFHPHVPQDPGVFTDVFEFGRDLAPINGGTPRGRCGQQLRDAAAWLCQALDLQGFRLDNAKGVSTEFIVDLLHDARLKGRFAVAEFADGNLGLIENWADAVQHLSSAFDFPLHFALKQMCNSPDGFDMATLDHAGLAGVDPLGAVTFVENHDTDRGGVGGPVIRNKLLAYAYILTSEGYPCVFYRDYSHDRNCFGLQGPIDRLIWIHEKLASGPTQQRWKDNGVFAFERLGGRHLLVALNKDERQERTISIGTGFPPDTELQNFVEDQGPRLRTDGRSNVTLRIPRNTNGAGYVCYAPSATVAPFQPVSRATQQEFSAAEDLDIGPARVGEELPAGRVFAAANTVLSVSLSADPTGWLPNTALKLRVIDPSGRAIGQPASISHTNAAQGVRLNLQVHATGFHSFLLQASSAPPGREGIAYRLLVTYTAPTRI